MIKKLSIRALSIIVACLILACSLPLAFIIAADDFESKNVFADEVENIKGVVMEIATGSVADHNQFNGSGSVFSSIFDGNKTDKKDVYGANDWGRNSGALITLKDSFYCGALKIFAGYANYLDTYKVYASDSLDDLYSVETKTENIVCDGSEKTVSLNRQVKYVAIFLTDYNGNGRLAELELWTAQKTETPVFEPENLLRTSVSEANGILYDTSNGSYQINSKFNENGAIAGATDGDTANHYDVYGWSQTTKVGVIFTLDDSYYVGNANIFSGLSGYPDYWSVYAADNLDDLFENVYLSNTKCENEKLEIAIEAKIKFIAFVFNSDGGRVKELELWSAEDTTEPPFEPSNVLKTAPASAKGILMSVSTGAVTDNDRFSSDKIQKTLDGDTATHCDVYGALDWDSPSYVGAVFSLPAPVYTSHAMIYSGFDAYNDTYRVYASDSLSNLYDAKSIVGDNIVCGDEGQRIEINGSVQYIAFICIGYNGNQRVKEFELWSAEKPEGEPEITGVKKVLTIGNSFAENASVFASEIAAAEGQKLTFGYLKYPSCTIAQHYDNAVNDNAVYKFAYTHFSEPSKQNIVKDGSSSMATIKEALDFADWDIVVIQQGSMASYDYSTYEKADELIGLIKSDLPNAEIMIHETWSWATWAADNNTKNDFKHIEDCYHQLSSDNGICPKSRYQCK